MDREFFIDFKNMYYALLGFIFISKIHFLFQTYSNFLRFKSQLTKILMSLILSKLANLLKSLMIVLGSKLSK